MHTVILANGTPPTLDLVRHIANSADMLICADGGARAALMAQLRPAWVVGDLDSLDADDLDNLVRLGAVIQRYPVRKDETDLELALRHAVKQGATRITILGALGGRVDQLLANILLLALPALREIPTRILDEEQEIQLITSQGVIHGRVGDVVSLVPIGGDAIGVETEGLEWALGGSTLVFGPARGISNTMTAPMATVKVKSGLLLAIRLLRITH